MIRVYPPARSATLGATSRNSSLTASLFWRWLNTTRRLWVVSSLLSDQGLHIAAQGAGLGQGGLDALVLDRGRGHVAQQCRTVAGLAAQVVVLVVVSHGNSLMDDREGGAIPPFDHSFSSLYLLTFIPKLRPLFSTRSSSSVRLFLPKLRNFSRSFLL